MTNGKPTCDCPSGFGGSHCHQKVIGGTISKIHEYTYSYDKINLQLTVYLDF